MRISVVTAETCSESGDDLDDVGAPEQAAYLRGFLRAGPAALATTQDLERFVVLIDGTPVPVIVNDGSEENNYVLSPYAHYAKYARLELDKISGLQARLLGRSVSSLGRASLPFGFNRCVSVNNWLFTTNPELRLTPAQLAQVTQALIERRPGYALVFRCVDAREPVTQRTFTEAGYKLVVNRPVHEWTPVGLKKAHRQQIRSDIKLLADPRFDVQIATELPPGAEHDVYRLYTALYVEKHRGYNCRYTARFFRLVHDTGMMKFILIRHQGRIVAFASWFEDGARTVLALVGYDTALDHHQYPLYRMLIAAGLRMGMERKRLVFLSTGAAAFKRNRGSYEWLEHEAVFDRHLPPYRRLPWATFKAVYDRGVKGLDTLQI